jgi:hypothetical protein
MMRLCRYRLLMGFWRGLALCAAIVVASAAGAPTTGAKEPDFILRQTSVDGPTGLRQVTWSDEARRRSRTVSYDARGHAKRQSAVSYLGQTLRQERVEYGTGEWRTITMSLPPKAHAGGVEFADAASYRAQQRDKIKIGYWSVVGHERLGGKQTLHLRTASNVLAVVDLWVEASTYRPVRQVETFHLSGKVSRNTTRFDWLPATPANRALTRLHAPPRFRRLYCTQAFPLTEQIDANASSGRVTQTCHAKP